MTYPQPYPFFHADNDSGDPLAGGSVYSYEAGTDIAQVTYSDPAYAVPNSNPIILDAMGEASIYLSAPTKLVWFDALGNLIKSIDNIGPISISGTLILIPLAAAPSNPVVGMTVYADRANWDPLSKGSGNPYMTCYNGSTWVAPGSQ